MRLSIGIVGLALLAACVQVHEVKGPDGKTALALKCGDATKCYQKAGELCPDGYDFVDKNNANVVGGANGYVYGGSVTTLLVECKTPATPATTKNASTQ
jgi:hypothetical protein